MLVVDPREQNVALAVCVGVVEGPRRRAKNSMLAAHRRGFSKPAAAKEKVPSGVEGRARIGGDMGGVRPQSRRGVAWRLGGES